MKIKLILALIVLSLFILNGCQSSNKEDVVVVNIQDNVKEENTEQQANVPVKEETKQEVKELNLIARQFEFEPNIITANKGDKVKLIIKSVDVEHGFALPDFNINKNLKPGETVIVEFTADKTGEFSFFCSVVCGSGHGSMRGKLIVN